MPNWVQNIMLVKDVDKYHELACVEDEESGELKVDFNKLVPVPKEFNATKGGPYVPKEEDKPQYEYDLQVALKCKNIKEFVDIMQPRFKLTFKGKPYKIKAFYSAEDFDDLINKSSTVEDQKIYTTISYVYQVYCKAKYGIDNWYDYRRGAWGCKWNASDSVADGTSFQTPWSAPRPWYNELAKKLNFIALYADEDLGANCGVYVARNEGLDQYCLEHVCLENVNINSEAFARAIHGYLYEDNIEQDIQYLDPEKDKDRISDLQDLAKNPEKYLKNFLEEIDCPKEYDDEILAVLGNG